MLVWAPKDPDEVVIRHIYWDAHRSWLPGDFIVSATFSLATAAGMTISASDHNDRETSQVTLTGGTNESVGKVLCSVVTDEGQTLQQTATILIRAR